MASMASASGFSSGMSSALMSSGTGKVPPLRSKRGGNSTRDRAEKVRMIVDRRGNIEEGIQPGSLSREGKYRMKITHKVFSISLYVSSSISADSCESERTFTPSILAIFSVALGEQRASRNEPRERTFSKDEGWRVRSAAVVRPPRPRGRRDEEVTWERAPC